MQPPDIKPTVILPDTAPLIHLAAGRLVQDCLCCANSKSGFDTHVYSSGETMSTPIHPVILRYAAGEIFASQAAGMLGDRATVADVLMMLRDAGLEPPAQPSEQARAELARARAVLGLPQIQD